MKGKEGGGGGEEERERRRGEGVRGDGLPGLPGNGRLTPLKPITFLISLSELVSSQAQVPFTRFCKGKERKS